MSDDRSDERAIASCEASGAAPSTPGRRFVEALSRGDVVQDVFLVRSLELRRTRAGREYLACDLADRTGTIPARHWEAGAALVERLRATPWALARGVVEEHGHELQVRLDEVAPVPEREVCLRDLIEHTPFDTGAILLELRTIFGERVGDPHVRRLLQSFLEDEPFVARLAKAPAASSYHHSYAGGLLEHVLSLTRAAERACDAYPRLDRDLMIAGAFLHDIGKVEELAWDAGKSRAAGTTRPPGFHYTDQGQLLGHIAIGVQLLDERARRIRGFPDRLRDLLRHLVLSHHGEKQYGSPVVPVLAEALALHALDDLDGKLWSAWRAIDDRSGEPRWSAPSRHLGRRVYRGPLRREPLPDEAAPEPRAHGGPDEL